MDAMGHTFGWDVSTSIVGVSEFDADGSYLSSGYLDLRKVEGFLSKCSSVAPFVRSWTTGVSGDRHFVEDRLGSFAAGRTMLQVLMKLAAFNAVVSWLLHEAGGEVSHIHPSRAKSLMRPLGLVIPKGGDKKALTLDFVRKLEPSFPYEQNRAGKPQPWCFDMADAFVVGKAGIISCSGPKS